MTGPKVRAAIYTRLSQVRGSDDSSTARQEDACRKYIEMRGWDVTAVYSDPGISAFGVKDRPGWMALERAVRFDEVDSVVVFAISRAARNTLRLLQFVETCKARGVLFESVSEPIGGEYGGVLLAVLGSLAQLESEMRKARAILKHDELLDKGLWRGGPRPFGYQPIQQTPAAYAKNTVLRVDPDEASVIRRGVTDLLNGVSLGTIARRWDAARSSTPQGGTWSYGDVRRVLYREHPDIVAHADHVRVREILDAPGRGVPHGGRYLLTGLLKCGVCGGRMGGRPQGDTPRYICKATGEVHLAVKARLVEETVARAASNRHIPAPKVAADPAAPLIAERDRIIREQEEWGASGLSAAAIRGRDKQLQRELEKVEAELVSVAPATTSWSALWDETDATDDEFYTDPATRAWLETLIDAITVNRAERPGARWDPRRVDVRWRDGVQLRGTQHERATAKVIRAKTS